MGCYLPGGGNCQRRVFAEAEGFEFQSPREPAGRPLYREESVPTRATGCLQAPAHALFTGQGEAFQVPRAAPGTPRGETHPQASSHMRRLACFAFRKKSKPFYRLIKFFLLPLPCVFITKCRGLFLVGVLHCFFPHGDLLFAYPSRDTFIVTKRLLSHFSGPHRSSSPTSRPFRYRCGY